MEIVRFDVVPAGTLMILTAAVPPVVRRGINRHRNKKHDHYKRKQQGSPCSAADGHVRTLLEEYCMAKLSSQRDYGPQIDFEKDYLKSGRPQ